MKLELGLEGTIEVAKETEGKEGDRPSSLEPSPKWFSLINLTLNEFFAQQSIIY